MQRPEVLMCIQHSKNGLLSRDYLHFADRILAAHEAAPKLVQQFIDAVNALETAIKDEAHEGSLAEIERALDMLAAVRDEAESYR